MGLMTGIALALTAASVATQAYGQKKQATAAKKAGQAQARVAESSAQVLDFNAEIADLQAKDAVIRGAEAESRFRTQIRGAIGTQRAGFAAGNIDVSFGSPVDVQADAAFLGELDALTIRTNAAREAWGFKVQAADIRKRAEITRKEGVNALTAADAAASAAKWAMGGTLLGGGATLLQMRYNMPSRSSAPNVLPSRPLDTGLVSLR